MNEIIARCRHRYRYSSKNVEALIKSSVLSTFNLSNLGKCKFVKFFDFKISLRMVIHHEIQILRYIIFHEILYIPSNFQMMLLN